MHVLTWNIRRATSLSKAWDLLDETDADLLFLQEVSQCPEPVLERYEYRLATPKTQKGNDQRFQTIILSKYEILGELKLESEFDWVNREFDTVTI